VRHVIACGVVLVAVGVVYVTYTMPSVDSRSQASSIVASPVKAESLPAKTFVSKQPGMTAIKTSLPVQAAADEAKQEEALDANDVAFITDDTEERNVGPMLDADDMSFVVDDSPQQNVGEILDADAGL
jgi:hypothetical protein